MRKDIKKLLNPKLVEKWKLNDLSSIQFNKGDLVTYGYETEESLGIVLEQDGIMATVQWTKSPDSFSLQPRVFVTSLNLLSPAPASKKSKDEPNAP